jgi:hypothetical protein
MYLFLKNQRQKICPVEVENLIFGERGYVFGPLLADLDIAGPALYRSARIDRIEEARYVPT